MTLDNQPSASGRSTTAPIVPDEHFREFCGCDYCGHPDWCGGEEHAHLDVLPLWPCDTVLAANGMTTAEEFFEAEGAAWEAWARAEHPEWFDTSDAASRQAVEE